MKRQKVSDLIKPVQIDQSAETTRDLMDSWGTAQSTTIKMVRNLYREGRIERVFKRVDGRLVRAYRTKGK